MSRSVGTTLRRTLGGGVVLALGFGAITASPQEVASVAASSSSPAINLALPATDRLPDRHPQLPKLAPQPLVPVIQIAVHVASTAPSVPAGRPSSRMLPTARSSRPTSSASGGANGFAYGYCTWWVAHKRYVPWRGDAAQWWWNARPFGYAEGPTPRVGAIMVMGAGGSASPDGHVAYVESVNANGSFVVSEMNWWGVPGGGWGRVDYRTVTSMRGILGFIY